MTFILVSQNCKRYWCAYLPAHLQGSKILTSNELDILISQKREYDIYGKNFR